MLSAPARDPAWLLPVLLMLMPTDAVAIARPRASESSGALLCCLVDIAFPCVEDGTVPKEMYRTVVAC